MALTYEEFKIYLLSFTWRQNDVDLSNDFDKILRMADAELSRKLNIQKREISTTVAPETEDYALPSDFYQMVSVSNLQPTRQGGAGEFSSTTLSTIYEQRKATNSQVIVPYYYTQRARETNTLFLIGPFSAANPGSLQLVYRTAIPEFINGGISWVEDEYLDLYVYAFLKHVGVYLREDERVQQYNAYLADAIASAIDEDNHQVKFGGSPLHMKPHHHVPRTKRY